MSSFGSLVDFDRLAYGTPDSIDFPRFFAELCKLFYVLPIIDFISFVEATSCTVALLVGLSFWLGKACD